MKKYIAEEESSLEQKGHPGNPFTSLHVSKNLSEIERLRLMVAKLEIAAACGIKAPFRTSEWN